MANDPRMYGDGTSSDDAQRTAYSERKKEVENQPTSDPLVKRYFREISRYERATSDWYEEGRNIERVYLDESTNQSSQRRFALLWANVDTMKPAVYAKTPVAQCSRRYKDRDPVARTAAEVIERATNTSIELYGVDEIFRMVRDDRLLPGRGTAWVRYEAVIEEYEEEETFLDPLTGLMAARMVTGERKRSEKACVDYVHWQDFGHNISRTWSDVWVVWRCVYMQQDEVASRFGSKIASELSYNAQAPVGDYDNGKGGYDTGGGETGDNYCKIYEVWDKRNNLASWIVTGRDSFLDSGEPPIDFSNFFPCPEPTYATKTSKNLIPKPDYCYYRDQAKEINDLTDKIGRLTEWLIVKGFIPGGPSTVADPLEEIIRDKGNRELFVQVESFSEWTEKGGAMKLIDWLPIQHVVQALQAAIEARSQLIQDVFQITGIADVLRGQTDPDETYGAVRLRSQTGSRRIRNTKDDLARFCRDIARLVAEVIAENFSPKSLSEITGFRYQEPQPVPAMGIGFPNMTNVSMLPGVTPQMMSAGMMDQQMMGHNGGPAMSDEEPGLVFDDRVMELLRNDKMRSFRIDIETDSTVMADEDTERARRTEFTSAAGDYLIKAASVIKEAPELSKTMGELLMFGLRAHKAGRNLEETIERDFNALVRRAEGARNQPPPVDPVIEVAKTQVEGDIEKNRINAQLKAKEMETDAQLEVRGQNIDAALKIRDQDIKASGQARDQAARMAGRLSNLRITQGVQ